MPQPLQAIPTTTPAARTPPAHPAGELPTPRLVLAGAPALHLPGQAALPLALIDGLLLAWLALEGPTRRGLLATLLWPDSAAQAARASLRQRLFKLRRLGAGELVSGHDVLTLAAGVTHDLAGAPALLGRETPAAGGELGVWLDRQRRQRLENHCLQEQARCDEAMHQRRWPDALALAQELLALAPLSEAAHRRLMRVHYLAGDRAAALLAFDRCERLLKDEVGARPDDETLSLLRTLEGVGAMTVSPAPAPPLPVSVLRPPQLVGRDAELRAADRAWARGQVLALCGEAGMGKSRLLEHLLPASALLVAARPGDAGLPLATLARLLRALAERTPVAMDPALRQQLERVLPEWAAPGPALALAAPQPAATPFDTAHRGVASAQARAGRLAGEAPGPAQAHDRPLPLQRAVAALLAGTTGLPALAIDDLHFADAASLQLLQGLLDEACPPARWALAYRPADMSPALRALRDGLLEQARLAQVPLAPLDTEALATLVDTLQLPGVAGARLAPALLARTGGNPLYVLETLKQAWADEQDAGRHGLAALADGSALPRPASVVQLVERRLLQLSPPALALARCVAVAAQDFSPALATRVLACSTLALADAWAELEGAQILRGQAFVHDLFHETALASLPLPLARHLHGEIATLLEGQPAAPPARLAAHWLAAGLPARALPHLELGAHEAERALDPAAAALCWAELAALRHANDDAAGAFDAAEHAVLLQRSVNVGTPLEAALQRLQGYARGGLQQARVHELRAAMLHLRGDAGGAALAIEQALQALDADAPAKARVALLNMHGVVLRSAGQLPRARLALEQALALARQAPADAGADLPAVLNNLGLLLQDQDEHLQAIALIQEAAQRQTDPLVRARVISNLAGSLQARGQALLARQQCLEAARAVHGAADVVDLNLAIQLAANARHLGHWREALTHLDEAQRLLQGQPNRREAELQRGRAALWLELGRPNLVREALDRARVLSAHEPVAAARCAALHAQLALRLGRDALPHLQPAAEVLQAAGETRALRQLQLVLAQALPPADALALLQHLAEAPTVRENAAAALPVQVRLAQVLLALQRAPEALRHAQRAADWLAAVVPLEVAPPEVWLTLARCAEAAGDAVQAAWAALQGATGLHANLAEYLDPPFVEGCLQCNPVHRDLLACAQRLGATATPRPSAPPGP